ncbi:hypothetical protein [Pasteuria penetrans]|uniref:hypothetical protein n=1 Tax=Pasteuria penetrans TaxID=86005 RepID=UPI0011EF406D|nr:hypothetical protein [Pasteuria penetrans]
MSGSVLSFLSTFLFCGLVCVFRQIWVDVFCFSAERIAGRHSIRRNGGHSSGRAGISASFLPKPAHSSFS